jgi:putative membrane protein insertion efficiency factor
LKLITETSSNDASVKAADRSLAVRLCLVLIRGYKIFISPYFRGSCRFLPSCADYAAEAIDRHGAARGIWLAAGRLLRCHPLCAAGHDPVPVPRGSVRL